MDALQWEFEDTEAKPWCDCAGNSSKPKRVDRRAGHRDSQRGRQAVPDAAPQAEAQNRTQVPEDADPGSAPHQHNPKALQGRNLREVDQVNVNDRCALRRPSGDRPRDGAEDCRHAPAADLRRPRPFGLQLSMPPVCPLDRRPRPGRLDRGTLRRRELTRRGRQARCAGCWSRHSSRRWSRLHRASHPQVRATGFIDRLRS